MFGRITWGMILRTCARSAWWWVRGVQSAEDYRVLCARCGKTGQAHWAGGCRRFKRSKTSGTV